MSTQLRCTVSLLPLFHVSGSRQHSPIFSLLDFWGASSEFRSYLCWSVLHPTSFLDPLWLFRYFDLSVVDVGLSALWCFFFGNTTTQWLLERHSWPSGSLVHDFGSLVLASFSPDILSGLQLIVLFSWAYICILLWVWHFVGKCGFVYSFICFCLVDSNSFVSLFVSALLFTMDSTYVY